MGNCRIALRVYLWSDDGIQIHVSNDPNPDGIEHLVKAELGDDDTPGMMIVEGSEDLYQDRAGRIWPYCQVDLWGWEWVFERKNLV